LHGLDRAHSVPDQAVMAKDEDDGAVQ